MMVGVFIMVMNSMRVLLGILLRFMIVMLLVDRV